MADYAETYRTFRLDVPERFNWAFDIFDGWARDPSKLALLWVSPDGQPRRFTFRELADRSKRFANVLAGLGVAPGERVFVMLPRVLLQEHVKTVTAPYKYPREIEFVPDLPKTISGKIRRTELRALERERGKK
jgi:acyl-coenzyme A synthetase/AMP-(fatty) acid ligase